MNTPIYKISGVQRRKLKKELSQLKSYAKNFWFYHSLDKDMTAILGGSGKYPMSDEKAEKQVEKTNKEIEKLEILLSQKL